MNRPGGYAVVVAMLVLIVLSALGMYVASVPLVVGQNARKRQTEAVARNMAKAGANAAVARLPDVIPERLPYARRFPVTRNLTGRYVVESRRSGGATPGNPHAPAGEDEYVVLSRGGVDEAPEVEYRVRAVIRYSRSSATKRITQWEESPAP